MTKQNSTHHLTVPVLFTAAAMTLEKRAARTDGGFRFKEQDWKSRRRFGRNSTNPLALNALNVNWDAIGAKSETKRVGEALPLGVMIEVLFASTLTASIDWE